jgi:death-on-curing protein
MPHYLDLDDLLRYAPELIGQEVLVRDYGLLEAALARPRASAFGQDAYPDLHVKAAALLHSLCVNHALVDGNKRLAWGACAMFLEFNSYTTVDDEDAQFEMVIAVASGALDDVEKIAERLRHWSHRADCSP